MVSRPEVGRIRSSIIRIVVDLPAPFGPRKPNTSPCRDPEGQVLDAAGAAAIGLGEGLGLDRRPAGATSVLVGDGVLRAAPLAVGHLLVWPPRRWRAMAPHSRQPEWPGWRVSSCIGPPGMISGTGRVTPRRGRAGAPAHARGRWRRRAPRSPRRARSTPSSATSRCAVRYSAISRAAAASVSSRPITAWGAQAAEPASASPSSQGAALTRSRSDRRPSAGGRGPRRRRRAAAPRRSGRRCRS